MPWTGKPITQPQLARLLKCFKIKPKPMRLGVEDMARCYALEDFQRALDRYAPRPHPQNRRNSVTTAEDGQKCRNKSGPNVTPKTVEDGQSYAVTPDMGGMAQGDVKESVPDVPDEGANVPDDADRFRVFRDPSLKLQVERSIKHESE